MDEGLHVGGGAPSVDLVLTVKKPGVDYHGVFSGIPGYSPGDSGNEVVRCIHFFDNYSIHRFMMEIELPLQFLLQVMNLLVPVSPQLTQMIVLRAGLVIVYFACASMFTMPYVKQLR